MLALLVWLGIVGLLTSPTAHGKPITEADRQHWAFQPLKQVALPSIRNLKTTINNPVDRFIGSSLEANGLAPAQPVSKEQFIRRVTFGLIGLPPGREEVDAFVGDSSLDAYEKLIDRLLASPHYGERWGRHWLDLARFAESDGFEHDAARPHSWRYRDYVVRAFNHDKPYNQFILEQLAGDELFPDNPEAQVATGFNLLGPDMVDSADQVQRRHNTLNDMTDTMALVFLGQTIGCARCHHHKSEPFSQRDYYQLQAFFMGSEFRPELPIPTAAERAAHEAEADRYKALTEPKQKEIEAIEAPHRKRLLAEKLAKLSEEAQLAHQTPKEQRTVEMQNQIQETADLLKISEGELRKAMRPAEKASHHALLEELRKFTRPTPLPAAVAMQNRKGPPPKTFLLERGDYQSPGDEVPAGVPEILARTGQSNQSPALDGVRSTLAKWVASPENPLTARVMVNRIWQHHFGRGIVATPSDFGTRGKPATHPELLDWLAKEFMAGGWSIKRIQKLILLSGTYRQSSLATPKARVHDPENKLFSRQNRVRLEGDAIRDSLLAMSGRLNRTIGGASVFPPLPADIAKSAQTWIPSANPADHARRSLYIFARRNLRFPFLEVFDAPDNNLSCPERGRSTTAPQSLTLLNSQEVTDAAKAAAASFMNESKPIETQIDEMFRVAISRSPSAEERALAHEFLVRGIIPGEPGTEARALQTRPVDFIEFCRALFNLNAFVYVD